MTQQVRTPDIYASRLFDWDDEKQIVSIVHGKELFTYKLGADKQFEFVERKTKQNKSAK